MHLREACVSSDTPKGMIEMTANWSTQPANDARLELPKDEIHVWLASLIVEPQVVQSLEATLGPDEVAKANRFVKPRDRLRFITARGILRELLAAYVDEPASALKFDYGAFGKPILRAAGLRKSMRFNLSHSHDLSLYAFSGFREVGVDIELLRPDFAGEEIASRFFAPQEVADLLTLPPELRVEGFFNCWTRKEAYVKARGDGLQVPLDGFHVSLIPNYPERLNSLDSARWTLRSLKVPYPFVAALVAEGSNWRTRLLRWDPQRL
jgi:4'-phosphopantetheinyl transferase